MISYIFSCYSYNISHCSSVL